MKKTLVLLLLIYQSTSFSQVLLTSYDFDLNNKGDNVQILNAENTENHDVFVFAVNGQNITILKYNNALFLMDQHTALLANFENKRIIGYSFNEDGNPSLYWSSGDLYEIIITKYYFESKTLKYLKFRVPSSNDYVVATFQKNNSFCLLSKNISEEILTSYIFNDGIAEQTIFDFSPYKFLNKKLQITPFYDLINENPLEKMELKSYNPLYKSTSKSKFYVVDDKIILTLDQNSKQTQVFELHLKNHTLIEKFFSQPIPQKTSYSSNSFFSDNKLFQVKANTEELLFEVKNYDSEELIKSISIPKKDSIYFKNSPLSIKKESQKLKTIKNTTLFLKYLKNLNIGLSVYHNHNDNFVTIGGSPNIKYYEKPSFHNIKDDEYDLKENSQNKNVVPIHTETVFFESTWDKKFEFISSRQEPFAIDNISNFISQQKEVTFENIIKFKDYYILGYYDSNKKSYVMRKFTDGYN
jgi:hypothetical protein